MNTTTDILGCSQLHCENQASETFHSHLQREVLVGETHYDTKKTLHEEDNENKIC